MLSEIIAKILDINSYTIILAFTVAIIVYCIFIWKFYRFISKRDLLNLNLSKYNKSEHPTLRKFFGTLLYLLEYIIILPGVVFLGFGILSLFFIIFSENQPIGQMLMLSASVVAAIRLISYFSESLSRDLAKLFPFAILAIFLLNPSFSKELLFDRISSLSSIIPEVFSYLLFVMAIEIIMRLAFLLGYQVWKKEY